MTIKICESQSESTLETYAFNIRPDLTQPELYRHQSTDHDAHTTQGVHLHLTHGCCTIRSACPEPLHPDTTGCTGAHSVCAKQAQIDPDVQGWPLYHLKPHRAWSLRASKQHASTGHALRKRGPMRAHLPLGQRAQLRLNLRGCDTIASTSPRAGSSSTMRLHNVVGRLHAAGLPNPRAGVEAAAARQVLMLPPSTRCSRKKTPCRQCCVVSTPACRRSGSGIAQAVAIKEVLKAQASSPSPSACDGGLPKP